MDSKWDDRARKLGMLLVAWRTRHPVLYAREGCCHKLVAQGAEAVITEIERREAEEAPGFPDNHLLPPLVK